MPNLVRGNIMDMRRFMAYVHLNQSVNNATDQQIQAGTVGNITYLLTIIAQCAVATTLTFKWGGTTPFLVVNVAANTPIVIPFQFPGLSSVNTNQSITVRHSDAVAQVVQVTLQRYTMA